MVQTLLSSLPSRQACEEGEILSLTWKGVHLGKRYVHLPDTKNGDSRCTALSFGAGFAERPAEEYQG